MDGGADEVIGLVSSGFGGLRGRRTEDFLYIERLAFQNDVGGGESANVTTGAGEWNPGCGNV